MGGCAGVYVWGDWDDWSGSDGGYEWDDGSDRCKWNWDWGGDDGDGRDGVCTAYAY